MALALVMVALIAIGLPLAAWWFSRNLKPPPQPLGRPTARSDPVDRWLFDHYQLGTVARGHVKTAVFSNGQVPSEPALQPAAHSLAAEVACGNLRSPRRYRWGGWTLIVEGACLTATLLAIAVLKSPYGLAGLWITLQPLGFGALAVREARRQMQRARRLDRLGQAGSEDARI
jgi:hypothetical protein